MNIYELLFVGRFNTANCPKYLRAAVSYAFAGIRRLLAKTEKTAASQPHD